MEDRIKEVVSDRYTVGGIIFITAGVITTVLSLLGILGAIKKFKYMLLMVGTVIMVIVITKICIVFGHSLPHCVIGDCGVWICRC